MIDKNENENAKAKAFTLASATNVPTDAEYDESKYRNGEQYLIHGKDTVTENEADVRRAISSAQMAKSTSGSRRCRTEDTYTVKYYQLVKKTENSYELTELTCTQQTKLGDYEEPSFTLVTKEATVENKVTTSTPGSGTALTLTTKTAEGGKERRGTRQCGVHADDYEHVGRHGQHDCRQNKQQRHGQQNVDRTDSRSVCHHDHRDRRLDK